MLTVNIHQLVGNIIIVTTPENLEADLEAKVSATLLKTLQILKAQGLETPEQNPDKPEPQSTNH